MYNINKRIKKGDNLSSISEILRECEGRHEKQDK